MSARCRAACTCPGWGVMPSVRGRLRGWRGFCVEACNDRKAVTPSMRGGFSWRAPCVAMAPDCSPCCCRAFRSVAAAIALCGAWEARDDSPTLSANDPSLEAIAGCVLVTDCHRLTCANPTALLTCSLRICPWIHQHDQCRTVLVILAINLYNSLLRMGCARRHSPSYRDA